MPMDRRLYPKNWDEIARRIKQSANWQCENCDRPCLLPKEDFLDFLMRMNWTVGEVISAMLDQRGRVKASKEVRFVLTTAHLNHCPDDCRRENLKALCSVCHCRMDLLAIPLKRQLKLERLGQQNLFDLSSPLPAGHGKDLSWIQIPIRQEVEQ